MTERRCEDCRERPATEVVDLTDLDPELKPEFLCPECAERANAWLKKLLLARETEALFARRH